MLRKIKYLAIGIILMVVGIYGVKQVWDCSYTERIMGKIEELPDYDYIAEIKSLMAKEEYVDAKVLCEDVIDADLPQAEESKQLKKKCEKECAKLWTKTKKMAKAFVTGTPGRSVEELGAVVVSDLCVYGDIRDLAKQGYFKFTGQETDTVVIALSSIGLLTEAIDSIDWVPAMIKVFHKLGSLSKPFRKSLVAMAKGCKKAKKITPETKALCENMGSFLKKSDYVRGSDMIKRVNNADDVRRLARATEKFPRQAHLVAKYTDDTKTIESLMKSENSLLRKNFLRKGLRALKYTSRLLKTCRQGVLQKFLASVFPASVGYVICAILFGTGAIYFGLGLKKKKTN